MSRLCDESILRRRSVVKLDIVLRPIGRNPLPRRDCSCSESRLMRSRIASTVGKPSPKYDVNEFGLLIRKSPSNSNYRDIQVQNSMLEQFPMFYVHTAGRKIYDTMHRPHYWPLMENDLCATVSSVRACTKIKGTQHMCQNPLRLFPAKSQLANDAN